MSKKVFVGGLAWTTNSDGLQTAFSKYGDISEAIVITDRDSGRSRGFGFVTFEDDSAAKSSLELNGTDLDGRTIRVDLATEKRNDRGGDRFGGGGGGGRNRY